MNEWNSKQTNQVVEKLIKKVSISLQISLQVIINGWRRLTKEPGKSDS